MFFRHRRLELRPTANAAQIKIGEKDPALHQVNMAIDQAGRDEPSPTIELGHIGGARLIDGRDHAIAHRHRVPPTPVLIAGPKADIVKVYRASHAR